MKILVFADVYPPLSGGSQVILHEICSRLPARSLLVYTSPVPGDRDFDLQQPFRIVRSDMMRPLTSHWPEIPEAERRAMARADFYCRWFPRSRLVRWLVYVRVVRDMVRAARRERADVILCGHPFLAAVAARCHRWMRGVPYAVYSYGEELAMLLRRRGLAWRLQRWALQRAFAVFAISRFSGDVVLAFGVNPARVHVQCPGVSEVFFGEPTQSPVDVKRSLGVAADAPVVLTAARLMERKGVDTVIRALPEVLRASPAAVYLVAGTGADEARLRRLAEELGLKSRVRFLGDASHEALVNYYHACDVFVMPNRGVEETGETETFGVVFLEANACGKPVIGGRVGGVLDAIEDGESGLLVDPTDVQAVATAIVRFLNDPEYARQVGERGRRRARERFSWDRNAAEVLQTLTAAACASRVS